MTIAEQEGLMLIRSNAISGFWMVKEEKRDDKSPRPFVVETSFDKHFQNRPRGSFATAAACALAIARSVGPEQSKVFALGYPEDTHEHILLSLRSPPMIKRDHRKRHGTCARCSQPLDTKSSWCSACHAEWYTTYAASWRGQSAYHLAHCKEHTFQRNGQKRGRNGKIRRAGREHAAPEWNTIDRFRHWLADTLERQQFACAYSQLPLTPNVFSIERLDETRGYCAANCVLVHRHFQGAHRQWSRDKFLAVPSLRKSASLSYEDSHIATFMRRTLHRCLNSTRSRNAKGREHTCDLTVQDLLQTWHAQQGRCAYLGVPLTLHGDWQASVERIDDAHGYTVKNSILIALEVQLSVKWSHEFANVAWPQACT